MYLAPENPPLLSLISGLDENLLACWLIQVLLTDNTGRRPIRQAAARYIPVSTTVHEISATSAPSIDISACVPGILYQQEYSQVGSVAERRAESKKDAVRIQDAMTPLQN